MEYSKDIVLGVKFFNGEDKHENLKVEGIRENKYDKVKNKTGNLQKVQPMRQNVRRNVNKLYFPLFTMFHVEHSAAEKKSLRLNESSLVSS